MQLSQDAKLRDRIRYAIAELQEAEKLFDCSTDPNGDGFLPTAAEIERRLIEATFRHFKGCISKMARSLGLGEKTVKARMRQYGLENRRPYNRKVPANAVNP